MGMCQLLTTTYTKQAFFGADPIHIDILTFQRKGKAIKWKVS